MSDRVVAALKFAILGAATGTVVATGTDMVFSAMVPLFNPGAGSSADNLGRASLALVTASASVAVGLYAGDQLMDYMGTSDDPLSGVVFFYTSCSQMQTFQVAPRIVKSWIHSLMTPAPQQTTSTNAAAAAQMDDSPPIGPRDLAVNMSRKPCMTGNCGGLNFN